MNDELTIDNKDSSFTHIEIAGYLNSFKNIFSDIQQRNNINVQLRKEVEETKDIFVFIGVLTHLIDTLENSLITIH